MTTSDVITVVVPFAVMILAEVLLRLINIGRMNRGRQYVAAVVAPIAAIVGIILATVWFDRFDFLLIDSIESSEILEWNLRILVVYIAVKLICMLASLLWKRRSFMEATSDTWYEYDEYHDIWFLKERYTGLRSLISAIAWAIAIIGAAIVAFDAHVGRTDVLWLRAFPISAVIVVTELFNFLNGMTKPEWIRDVGGEGIGATRISAYYKLRKVLEDLFGSALLVSHFGNEYGIKEGATSAVDALQKSVDPIDRKVGSYFANLKKPTGLFNIDMIKATSTLMHGKTVLLFDPHYRDLGDYLTLPIVDCLLNNRKALVVVGRRGSCADVLSWLREQLKGYSHTRSLWRAEMMDNHQPDCEVGVLSFSQLYDADVINANGSFLDQVSFVLLVEPSKMIATSQIGLSILAERISRKQVPTYCICDHDTDGLLDALSHVLQTNITHAIAPQVPRTVYSAMGWSATGDYIRQQLFGKQTHFLGNGMEIAAVALKNQVPHVSWFSEEKAPVRDIRWIAGQYYPQICRYANLPSQQSSLDDRMTFSSSLWGSPVSKEAFVIAEDELCNMFATMRAYLSRGENQSFVNVISENYLLRDYMRYNKQLFMNDPKAVPGISSHYAKTERNTVIRLILMMSCGPVDEEYVAHELDMLGRRSDDIYRAFSELIRKYTSVNEDIVTVQARQEIGDSLVPIQISCYSISRQVFDKYFADTLKNAFFVVEDEKFGTEFIDARLYEHVTQIVMPGQYLTYDGKYYKVHAVRPDVGCILHRAADSYDGRRYYRQIRDYAFDEGSELVRSRKVMDLEISVEKRAFEVTSGAYLELFDTNDLRTARLIDFSKDPEAGVYRRSYKQKNVLKIVLPGSDERVRFTICMLLNEAAHTLFPNAWPYLAFLCSRPEDIEGMLDKFSYRATGAVDEDAIYVVEDSDMDLGLIEAVEDNLMRLFEIIADYLEWHFEKMREPRSKDPVIEPVIVKNDKDVKKTRNPFMRIARRLAAVFQRSQKVAEEEDAVEGTSISVEDAPQAIESTPQETEAVQTEAPADVVDDEPAEQEAEPEEPQVIEGAFDEEPEQGEDATEQGEEEADDAPPEVSLPAADLIPPDERIVVVEERLAKTEKDFDEIAPIELMEEYKIEPSRYQRECFLKFGFDEIDSRLAIEKVTSYLRVRGWTDNGLTKARKRDELDITQLDLKAENRCDFCGMPLSGVSFDRLADGRVRCNDCSATVLEEVKDYREAFENCEMILRSTFDITMPASISVKVADAREIAKRAHSVFTPSTDYAARVLGFAQKKSKRSYVLAIENGSPRLAAIETMIHEMTHIWQFIHWDQHEVLRLYAMNRGECTGRARDIVYEGMAVWASIQALYAMGETRYARQLEVLTENRDDIYGLGFIIYRDRYGMDRTGSAPITSPFKFFPPVEQRDVYIASKVLCTRGDKCSC